MKRRSHLDYSPFRQNSFLRSRLKRMQDPRANAVGGVTLHDFAQNRHRLCERPFHADDEELAGFELVNLDIMVMAEVPKLAPHREAMRANVAAAFRIGVERVAIKATTMEKMGFLGRREGVAVMASALLRAISREP